MKKLNCLQLIVDGWLRRSWRVVLLLALFNCQFSFVNSVSAQEAFYIYQNDGHFDGFFYDQVESISYSKIDTLGRECLDYVVQEIVTADSTYRIMLSAIDSVSFVQPEIKFNPRLRRMDELGMLPYLKAQDGMKLTFDTSLPASLRPQKEDVLVGYDDNLWEDGFGGKVRSVSEVSGGIVVELDSISSYSDLFVQLVTIEEMVSDGSPAKMRRRMAGMPKKIEGNWSLDAYNFAIDFKDTYKFTDNMEFSIGLHGGFGVSASVVYKFTGDDFYFKLQMAENVELGVNAGLSLTLAGDDDDNVLSSFPGFQALADAMSMPIPYCLPIMNLNATPVPFLRGKGTLSVEAGYSMGTKKLKQTLEVRNGEVEKFELIAHDAPLTESEGSLKASLSGYAQLGLSFPVQMRSNRFSQYLVNSEIGAKLYTGPKITGSIVLDELNASSVSGLYKAMKNSEVTVSWFSIDCKVSAKVKTFGIEHEISKEWGHEFSKQKLGLFPEFEAPTYNYDPKKPSEVYVEVETSGDVFYPQFAGIGLYNEKGELVRKYYRPEVYGLFLNNFNKVSTTFDNLETGKYQVLGLIDLTVISDIPARPDKEEDEVWVEIHNRELKVGQEKFVVGPEKQQLQTSLETSALRINITSNAQEWLTAKQEGESIIIDVQKYEKETGSRSGTIKLDALFDDYTHGYLYIDVMQTTGKPDEPIIDITPQTLELAAEGETKEAQMATNCTELTCTTKATWIHPTVGSHQLSVTVDPTDQADERIDSVMVKGTLNDKETVFKVIVKQAGALKLSEKELTYTAEGGAKTVTVTLGGNLTVTADADCDWLTTSYSDGKLTVTAEENFETAVRKAKVTVKAKAGNNEIAATIDVTQRAYIVLTPNVIECDKKGGVFTVDVETDLTNITIDAVMDWVGLAISSDRKRLTVNVEPNETGRDRQGSGLISGRKSDGTIISSSIIVKQSGDEEAPPTSLVMQEITSSKITPDPDGCNKDYYLTCMDFPGMEGKEYVYVGRWIIAYNGLGKNDMYEDIYDAFRHNDVIQRKDDGSFSLNTKELKLNGQFDDETNATASGTFSIDASFFHQRKTVAEAEQQLHEGGIESVNMLLNATISHQITGTFTCQWNDETQLYDFHFTGSGPFQISGTYFNQMTGSSDIAFYPTAAQPTAVITGTAEFADEGNTTVDLTISYLWQE